MGAGKSHTVRWMWEAGHFPLEAIVHLDPDLFKTAMPEWDGYVALDPMSAGQRTQRESGYLVEIAQAAAMAERRRVSAGGRREDTSMGRPRHVQGTSVGTSGSTARSATSTGTELCSEASGALTPPAYTASPEPRTFSEPPVRSPRRDHPAYRLAILHVTASEEQIFARVRRELAESYAESYAET